MAKKQAYKPTLDEEIEMMEQDLAARKRMYPKWTTGPHPKITKAEADKRLACLKSTIKRMKAIRQKMETAQQVIF